jgi:hypothetical protein
MGSVRGPLTNVTPRDRRRRASVYTEETMTPRVGDRQRTKSL